MTWQIDAAHSEINFTVRHMMISKVRGQFQKFNGTVNFDEDNPANTTVDITIEVDSIHTREEDRDTHLKSPDFFDVETYPVMTFKSTNVEKLSENTGKLHGDLTIKGVTKPVILDVDYAGQAQSPWGTTSAGFSLTGSLNRKDWGLNWNQALETGGFLVGDKINIEIEVELVKQPDAVPA